MKMAHVRAIWAARMAFSSSDWALTRMEPGRATLSVHGRPVPARALADGFCGLCAFLKAAALSVAAAGLAEDGPAAARSAWTVGAESRLRF